MNVTVNATSREEPSFEPIKVDEWVADVRGSTSDVPSRTGRGGRRSRSATPWLLAIGTVGAFGMLMAFAQVVEGSMRDAPQKRARAERVAACTASDAAATGVVCSDAPSAALLPSTARRQAGAYAQLSR
ncbi:MAG: hypothetical protein JWQ11_2497 [Rhizobacter sp.]|nr:hypothetical protein [Rhizobacter sp.]